MPVDADKILRRFDSLEGRRSEWEGVWQQCADYVLPRLGKSGRRADRIFDSTAPLALSRFAAAMESVLVPRTQKWHNLVTGREDLDQRPEVRRYLDGLRDNLFAVRYAPEANFANQVTEALLSLGVFGTAVVFVDDRMGRGLRYQCIPVHEVYLAGDAAGRVDTVFRWYRLTARQAREEFGEELPDDIRRDAEDARRMEAEHEFIHGVFPRKDFKPGRVEARNMPVVSVHIARAARRVVRESGYRTMPYAVSRYTVSPGEVYGRSPAMEAMPEVVQLNEMKKTILRAGQKIVDPPLLIAEDDILSGFNLKSGALNFGGLDEQGRPRVVPLQTGGNLPVGLELIEDARRVVNDVFHNNLFQILVETPQKTATEVIERAQEKAQLLAPVMGRQQSELLRPLIEREMDILIAAGAVPPVPEELAEAGAEVHPKYETPMAQALDSRDGQAILNAIQGLGLLAQVDPTVTDLINAPEAGRKVWVGFGASTAALRTPEEVAEKQQERAEREREAVMMEQARAAVGGIESLANAESKLQPKGGGNGGVA